jgi:hypothetical protein
MEKYQRTPEEIAKDLDSVVLPGISEEDLADAFGGTARESITVSIGC